MNKAPSIPHEPTPVDDVRRVRERLTQEAGGDIAKLAEQAERARRSCARGCISRSSTFPRGRARRDDRRMTVAPWRRLNDAELISERRNGRLNIGLASVVLQFVSAFRTAKIRCAAEIITAILTTPGSHPISPSLIAALLDPAIQSVCKGDDVNWRKYPKRRKARIGVIDRWNEIYGKEAKRTQQYRPTEAANHDSDDEPSEYASPIINYLLQRRTLIF